MAGLRLLLRLAPLAAAAIAAAVWLRRQEEHTRLAEPPPPHEIEPPQPSTGGLEPAGEVPRVDPDPCAAGRAGRFGPRGASRQQSSPIDIVTIVDDLLLVGR